MNCGPSFESERLVCFGYVSCVLAISENTSAVVLHCPLATDSFISLFISVRGELSNIDAVWKCGISDDFWSVFSSFESERFGMSHLNVKSSRDFSDQVLPIEP